MSGNRKKRSTIQKTHYKTYAAEHRALRNKILTLRTYVKHNPNDVQAQKALQAAEKQTKYTKNRPKNRNRNEARRLRELSYLDMRIAHPNSFREVYAKAIVDFAEQGHKVKGFKKAQKVLNEA